MAVNVQLGATNEAVAAISSRHERLAMMNGQTYGSRRLNIGCGLTPTPGWGKYDNSPTAWLARLPLPAGVLGALSLISAIADPGGLNLREREAASLYLEARRPQ